MFSSITQNFKKVLKENGIEVQNMTPQVPYIDYRCSLLQVKRRYCKSKVVDEEADARSDESSL